MFCNQGREGERDYFTVINSLADVQAVLDMLCPAYWEKFNLDVICVDTGQSTSQFSVIQSQF